MSKNKPVKTVKIKTDPVLCNPEDYFQDMINDGFSIHEALMTIIGDELVYAKLHHMFPDGYEVLEYGWDNPSDGRYVIQLTEGYNHDEVFGATDGLGRELIASDKDMAEA